MKILAVSDQIVDRLYSAQVAERFRDVKLILGCGDLPYEYLEFLVSALNIPLLYVPGNHDPGYHAGRRETLVEGGIFLDRRVERIKGLNIAGIGGSIRYKPDGPNQYTQNEMYSRVLRFLPRALWHTRRNGGVLDILIAHSPPRGIHDEEDGAHVGFTSFQYLLRRLKPRYFLHGHTLVYKSNIVPPVTEMGPTTIINVYPYRVIDI